MQTTIAKQLRSAILASNESHRQIALRSGIDKAQISRFLAGKSGLSIASAESLAEVLGLKICFEKTRAGATR
jgi:transcriptional regulator with XRE-family HTH domain